MAGNVKIILPREKESSVLRVAAYCRVSTDHTEQALSYASQIRNYTDLINGHEGWELVDVYADEAVSGTKTDKREDFNRMLSDCRKGRIDKVLVKSLSRFSRNTKDCLAALRELMSLGVAVQFEKENIDTETLTTEFLVSVFGALAQQESVSISENGRQGFRRRMELGQFITTKPPYRERTDDGTNCTRKANTDHSRHQGKNARRRPLWKEAAGGRLLPGLHRQRGAAHQLHLSEGVLHAEDRREP